MTGLDLLRRKADTQCGRRLFQNVEYKTVRDRQMREMDIEDDILSKAPVRYGSLLLSQIPTF